MATAVRYILPQPDPQLLKLEALRSACDRALLAASRGELFATTPGMAVLNAIHDLTEIDAVFDMAADCAREFGLLSKDNSNG